MEYVAFDAHQHYTVASVATADGQLVREARVEHEPGALRGFLDRCEPGSPVAVETTGNWYWIVDEIEAAGCVPKLVHARKAKLMLGMINKTDTLDARGLNRRQRTGTLPTVWIPPGPLRDQRDLPRTRLVLIRQRTQLKNRIHATLAKYGSGAQGSAIFLGRGVGPDSAPSSTPARFRRPIPRGACSPTWTSLTARCVSSSSGCGPSSRRRRRSICCGRCPAWAASSAW